MYGVTVAPIASFTPTIATAGRSAPPASSGASAPQAELSRALVEVRALVVEQPEALAVGLARHHGRFEWNQFVFHEACDEVPDHPVVEFEVEIHEGR